MTAFNSEKYIQQAIDSVLNQSFTDFEFIIVNDGSNDRTDSIIQKCTDNRIRYFSLHNNSGIAEARNYALSKVEGKYTAFIDSDDVWEKNKLSDQIHYMITNHVDFSYTYYRLISENGDITKIINTLEKKASYESLLKSNYIPFLTVVIRSNLIKKAQFVDTNHEDYATWLKILRTNKNILVCLYPKVTANYRVRINSISANKFRSVMWSWKIYRVNESLSPLKSVYYISTNICKGLFKRLF